MFEINLDTEVSEHYRYEHLSKKDYASFEFGIPNYRNSFFHKMPDDVIVASYCGRRFVEWHPNGDIIFLFKDTHTPSVSTRMGMFFSIASVQKKTNALGDVQKRVFIRVNDQRLHIDLKERLTVRCIGNKIVFVPDEIPVSKKDNKKYTAFNKQLKELKAVAVSQCRFGLYKGVNYREAVWKMLGNQHMHRTDIHQLLYSVCLQWLETKDPNDMENIVSISLYLSYSCNWKSDVVTQVSAVKTALRHVQTTYLRQHCLI